MKTFISAAALAFCISCAEPPEMIQVQKSSGDAQVEVGDIEPGGVVPKPADPIAQTPLPAPVPTPVVTPTPSTPMTPVPAPAPTPTPVVVDKPFNPCPAKGTSCIIMPFGDSITAGAGSKNAGGYREPLFHLAVQANQNITFVGPGNGGPEMVDGKMFPKANAGYSGYTIEKSERAGIAEKAEELLKQYKPHIVTLMIGTNDVSINNDLVNAPKRLAKLVDLILTTSPNTLLVLAQIVPSKDANFNKKVEAYNLEIAALVKTRADAKKHIIMVDQYASLAGKDNVLADNLHPNEAGYVLMADTWYKGLKSYFP